jgi:hypothetical protein
MTPYLTKIKLPLGVDLGYDSPNVLFHFVVSDYEHKQYSNNLMDGICHTNSLFHFCCFLNCWRGDTPTPHVIGRMVLRISKVEQPTPIGGPASGAKEHMTVKGHHKNQKASRVEKLPTV